MLLRWARKRRCHKHRRFRFDGTRRTLRDPVSPVKMSGVASIAVQLATSERWDALADFFQRPGPRGGTPFTAGCWCQYWHLRGRAFEDGWGETHRGRLEEQVRGGEAPGLLAYLDGETVGWCRLGPRESFERLEHSTALARVDDEDVWSLVCFAVHVSARRRGVAGALIEAAASHAAARDATLLEAYPVRAGHHVIDSFTGYLPMFLAAGFEPVREAGRRTIVRRRLGGQPGGVGLSAPPVSSST